MIYNVFDRPRNASTPLTRALTRDGIFYFLALVLLHTANVLSVALLRPTAALVVAPALWSLGVIAQNRFVLNQTVPLDQFAQCQAQYSSDHPGTLGSLDPLEEGLAFVKWSHLSYETASLRDEEIGQ